MTDPPAPMIFNSRRLQAKLDRGAMNGGGDAFLWEHMATDIGERLEAVSREFTDILLIGPATRYEKQILGLRPAHVTAASFSPYEAGREAAALIENDHLPFDPGSFDLIVSIGMLDSVNDLPGMLIQCRRALRSDGLFLGSMFGAGSLSALKSMIMAAEGESVAAHIHPQIDLKMMADLIMRTGFALPVLDVDRLEVRYRDLAKLLADLRSMGLGNVLAGEQRYFGKEPYAALLKRWEQARGDTGKVSENFTFLQISGWAPSDDQPKPALRGSATVSLADVLSPATKSAD